VRKDRAFGASAVEGNCRECCCAPRSRPETLEQGGRQSRKDEKVEKGETQLDLKYSLRRARKSMLPRASRRGAPASMSREKTKETSVALGSSWNNAKASRQDEQTAAAECGRCMDELQRYSGRRLHPKSQPGSAKCKLKEREKRTCFWTSSFSSTYERLAQSSTPQELLL
jgi:hypothetical protein